MNRPGPRVEEDPGPDPPPLTPGLPDDSSTNSETNDKHGSSLFGRGMLFVVIWSMQLIVSTVISPVLAHTLPPQQFGSLAAAIALYQLLIIVSVFGIDQALEMQRVEDEDDDERSRGLLATGTVFAFTVAGLLAISSSLWADALGFRGTHVLVLITMLWTAPGAAVLMVLGMLQAEDKLRRFTIVSLISTVGSQIVGLVLLFTVHRDAVTYAMGGAIGQMSAFLLGLAWTRPRWSGLRDTVTTKRALRLGLPLVLTSLSEFVLTAADRFVIQRWLGPTEVARYQVAFTVGNALTLLLLFTNRAWLPRLKGIRDEDARWRTIAASRDGVYQLLAFAVLGVTVAAPPILRVVAPPSYRTESLASIVLIIGLAAVPVAAMGATTRMLVTIRWGAPMAWASGIAVVVKGVLTFCLLPILGLAGAAWATFLGLAVQAWWLRRALAARHKPIPVQPVTALILFLCLALSAVSLALPQTMTWNIARFVAGASCLVPFVIALRRLQRLPMSGG